MQVLHGQNNLAEHDSDLVLTKPAVVADVSKQITSRKVFEQGMAGVDNFHQLHQKRVVARLLYSLLFEQVFRQFLVLQD
jgi:hypothetical protein